MRCKSISYTNKKIISEKEWNDRINAEIERVRNLKTQAKNSPWIYNERIADKRLWEMDDLIMLDNLGKTKSKQLLELGIKTIDDLNDFPNKDDIKIKGIKKILMQAASALPGNLTLQTLDYTKALNPYEAKYKTEWKEYISNSTALSPFVSINTIVMQMMDEAATVMKGSIFEHTWVFYHDALSLMTSKACISWMKETQYGNCSIFDRWLLPVNGLNEKTRYENKVVGNSPEFMPLDNSLNRDIQNCHDYHCILTNHLHRDDFRRFSKATPNLIDRGVRRIWDDEVGCPGSARILADIEKATNAMMMVMLEKGKMVPKLVNRNGHRNEKAGQSKRGGNNSIGCQQRKKK